MAGSLLRLFIARNKPNPISGRARPPTHFQSFLRRLARNATTPNPANMAA
jgi:hypothetical protein